jgi:hypothetical protein
MTLHKPLLRGPESLNVGFPGLVLEASVRVRRVPRGFRRLGASVRQKRSHLVFS